MAETEALDMYKLAQQGHLDALKARLHLYTSTTGEEGKLPRDLALRSTDDDGRTALHWAAASGKLDVVEYLADEGAPIDTKDDSGWTPLLSAVSAGHEDVVRFLLGRGANPVARNDRRQTTLHYHRGRPNILELLLQYVQESHVNAKDDTGMTPLHRAAMMESDDAMRVAHLLLEAGARIDPVDDQGSTPLHLACDYGNAQMAMFLFRHGASVTIRNDEGKTPMEVAPYGVANVLSSMRREQMG